MWGWIGAGAALLAVVIASLNLDFIKHANTWMKESAPVHLPIVGMATSSLQLASTAFAEGGAIPAKYTCDGDPSADGVSPPLSISGIPAEARSLALIMDDPDVPKALKPDGVFDHWVLFNISASTTEIMEGQGAGVAGRSGAGKPGYIGPCPPPQYQPSQHRYFFKLYALDSLLDLPSGASRADVEQAMQGHVLEQTELMGTYERQR